MQFIIVNESDSQAQIDYQYIRAFIDRHYPNARRRVRFTPVFLSGKPHFGEKEKEISQKIKDYASLNLYGGREKPRQTVVCFFLDVDEGAEAERLNPEIRAYCKTRGYHLVWFRRDVEEVFLGRQVSDKEKRSEVVSFLRKKKMDALSLEPFSSPGDSFPAKNGTSNIKDVLDGIFKKYK